MASADLEFLGADQDADRARVQAEFTYVAQGDQMAAVDADEAPGAPALLQGGQRDAHQMAALVGVQPGVVALGLDMGDLLDGHEAGHAAEFDGYVVRVGLVHGYPGSGADQFGGPPDGLAEALLADRLEDVVDGLEVERLHGEVLVRGDEHDQRRLGEPGEQPGQVEAVETGHVDVEEDDVDRLGPGGPRLQRPVDPAQRLGGVPGARRAADPGIGVQEVQQFLQRGAFVVDSQGTQHERGV